MRRSFPGRRKSSRGGAACDSMDRIMFPAALLLFLVLNPALDRGAGAAQDQHSPLPSAPAPVPGLENVRNLTAAGKYRESLLLAQWIKAKSPDMPGLNHELGVVYYHLGGLSEATGALRQAIAESAEDHEAQQLLGMSYFQLGRPAEAIPWLEKIKELMPAGNVDVSYVLGLCYLNVKDYEKARGSFAMMYGVPPGSAAACLFTARMLLRQGQEDAAGEYARKAAAIDSRLPLVHLLLGEIALFKAQTQQAREEFQEEIKLNPGHAGTYERLADAYLREGDMHEPEALLKRSLLLDPNSTGPYILLGKLEIRKKEYAQAATYLEKAARMDPGNFITHHLLGEAYNGMGKPVDAERELKNAAEIQAAQHPKAESSQ